MWVGARCFVPTRGNLGSPLPPPLYFFVMVLCLLSLWLCVYYRYGFVFIIVMVMDGFVLIPFFLLLFQGGGLGEPGFPRR